MNLYNVMIYYKGEGSTNIYIPGLGDTNITYGRPIYLKNASFNVIEALRQFRTMQIDIKINVDGLGAFRTVDLSSNKEPIQRLKPVNEINTVSNDDIKSILSSASNGPIPVENKTQDYGSYILQSGQYEGKTLKEVDEMGKLKAVYNGFKSRNPEVKAAIEKYYESQVN